MAVLETVNSNCRLVITSFFNGCIVPVFSAFAALMNYILDFTLVFTK